MKILFAGIVALLTILQLLVSSTNNHVAANQFEKFKIEFTKYPFPSEFPPELRKAPNENNNILPLDADMTKQEQEKILADYMSWYNKNFGAPVDAQENSMKISSEITSLEKQTAEDLKHEDPTKQNYSSKNLVRMRFAAKQLLEPESIVISMPVYTAIDLGSICGELDPKEKASDFCAAASWIAQDRKKQFAPVHPQEYEADNKRKFEDQQLVMALFLLYVKFTPAQLSPEKKHALFGLPYFETFRHQPDSPICSFNEKDLEFFPFEGQVLRRRFTMREQYEYLIATALPKFPQLFPGSDDPETMQNKIAKEIVTWERFAWAMCQLAGRLRSVPGTINLGFMPPLDLIPSFRNSKAFLPFVEKPENTTQLFTVKTHRYVAPKEEIVFAGMMRDEDYPSAFVDLGQLDRDEAVSCAVIELPANYSDPLWNPCLADFLKFVRVAGLIPHNPSNRVAYDACIRPGYLEHVVSYAEKMQIYNKSCDIDNMFRERHQRQNPQTRFQAAQYLSLMVRVQVRISGAKLARMDALNMKRKQQSNVVPDEIKASPNFDLIYEFATNQKKLLMKIQTQLTQMMKDAKSNFEVWKKDEARKAKELEDARLIRLGLKELDDDDDDDENAMKNLEPEEEEEGDDDDEEERS